MLQSETATRSAGARTPSAAAWALARIAAILLFTLASTSLTADIALAAPAPHLTSIPSNTWVKLSPTPTTHFYATNFASCSASRQLTNPIGRGFSGPAFGDGKLFYFGGAHLSHPGNDVDLYDVTNNVWQQSYAPECLVPCSEINSDCSGCTDPRDNDICRIRNGSASQQVITPAGRPYVEQTYQQHAWDPVRRQFMNGLRSGLWGYDPVAKTWQWWSGCGQAPGDGSDGNCGTVEAAPHQECRLANPFNRDCANPTIPQVPYPSVLGARLLVYDPDLQTVVWNGGGRFYKFNFTTRAWTEIVLVSGLGTGDERFSAYNPDGHYHLVALHGSGSTEAGTPPMFKVDMRSGTATQLTSVPAEFSQGGPICWPSAMSYDTVNRVFLVMRPLGCATGTSDLNGNGPVELWEYNPNPEPQGVWRKITLAGTTPVGRARWQPLWYDVENNAFLYLNMISGGPLGGMNEGDVETWVFRYNSGITPAPVTPSPTGLAGTPTTTRTSTLTPARSNTPTTARTNTATATRTSGAPAATATPAPTSAAGLDIPLTIQELLPANDTGGYPPTNVAGRARTQEPVTSGLPIPDTAGISATSQLAIVNSANGQTVPAQFRVLRRYPSGNIQWVLADFQADVAAGGSNTGLHLMARATTAGASMATDGASAITVNTGAATFSIRKANQNLLDAVSVGGQTLVTAGHAGGGITFVDSAGVQYTSANDSGSTATIEENGPLRVVVKQQGRLDTAGGIASLGYTARLTFYAGKTYAKAQVSIENAFRDSLTRKSLGSIEVRLPLAIGSGNLGFELARRTDSVTGTLASGETAYLFQGRTSHKSDSSAVAVANRQTFFREENDWGLAVTAAGLDGYTIVQQSNPLQAFQGVAEYSRGYGDLRNSTNRGVSVAMRDFDSFFPSAIELTGNGEVAVEIWSKRNTATLTFGWGAHDTRDIVFDFHTGAPDPLLTHYRAQYPLFARAPYDAYRAAAALLGRSELVSFDEMVSYHQSNDAGLGVNQFAQANAIYGITAYNVPNQQIVRTRSYNWSDGGRQTNNDYSAAKLLTFLQLGQGGQYQSVYNFVRYIADQAVRHSDREDRATWPQGLNGTGPGSPYAVAEPSTYVFEDDMEHENVLGLVLMYHLTGEEILRDAILDHGEWLAREHPLAVSCRPGSRGVSQRTKWNAILWEMTGDARYKTELDKAVDNFLCSTISDSSDNNDDGQDMNRGFVYDYLVAGSVPPPTQPRVVPAGAGLQIWAECLTEALRILPDSDARKEELADRYTGLAYYAMNEAYFDRSGDACPAFSRPRDGIVSSGTADAVDFAPAPETTRTQANLYDQTALMTQGFRQTRDQRFLYVGRRIVGAFGTIDGPRCGTVASVRQMYAPYASFAAQRFIWSDLHQGEFGVVFLNDDPTSGGGLSVTNNGGGSYTLRWTVPANALRYQIKYGPQPMVPNLNFDQYARTYQYDPAAYDNFWAGNGDRIADQPRNVPNEPAPAAAGTQQSFTITGLPAGTAYRFALRIETGTQSGTPASPPSPPTLL